MKMEASQIAKKLDNIKNTFMARASRGCRYRIDVLWTDEAEVGDKFYVQDEVNPDEGEEAANEAVGKFSGYLDELQRNDNVGRLTVKLTNRGGRNAETYTIVLREAYAAYPRTVNVVELTHPKAQQTEARQPQASPFGGLGSILGVLAGDGAGALGAVDDNSQQGKELRGLRALLDFRDQRKEEQFEKVRMSERNAALEAKLKEAEERAAKLAADLETSRKQMRETMDNNAKEIASLKDKIEGLEDDNSEMEEAVRKVNPANSFLGVSLSQLGGSIVSAAAEHLARSHAGFLGSLLGVDKDQFLGMLDERAYQRNQTAAQRDEADDDDAPEVTVDMDGADGEAQPVAEPARAQDPISTYTDSLAQWLRNADDGTRNKFTAIIQEIAKDSDALDDVYNMTVTQ